jgi:hypothetical protein
MNVLNIVDLVSGSLTPAVLKSRAMVGYRTFFLLAMFRSVIAGQKNDFFPPQTSVLPPSSKNVERVISKYIDYKKSTFFLKLTTC